MEIHVPLPWMILVGVLATLMIVPGFRRIMPAHRITRGVLGTSSVLAGIGWFVAYGLIGSLVGVQASEPVVEATAEAPDAPDTSSPSVPASPANAHGASDVRTLSVEPREGVGAVRIDRQRRPAWVESASLRVGPLHTTAVSSGPWLSAEEARRALDERLLQATREYLVELVDHPNADLVTSTYTLADVKNRLLTPDHLYEERVEGELSGSTCQLHALLQFDESFRTEALQRWREIVTRIRLTQAGLAAGGLLLLVAMLFGLLRADTATRGYYTRTLQILAAVTILGIVAAGVLLAKKIPWL